jgi:hypothetical protein
VNVHDLEPTDYDEVKGGRRGGGEEAEASGGQSSGCCELLRNRPDARVAIAR